MEGRDEIAVRDAEKSGRAASTPWKASGTAKAPAIMNRIREAARSNQAAWPASSPRCARAAASPICAAVQQRPGGREGRRAAYDKAASALARYGQDRTAVEQIIARRPDAANLSAKFEQMDAQIGEAAAAHRPAATARA